MLPKPNRLRASRDFKRTYSRGRSYVHPILVLYVLPNRTENRRIGFSLSKKLGDAVDRNRMKRRLREACRMPMETAQNGFDAILVGRSRLGQASFGEIQTVINELFRRARLLPEDTVTG